MSGAKIVKLQPKKKLGTESETLSPERAAQLLEHNTLNRPISDQHVQRIARQILAGKWRFNGDTIKISEGGDVLDGQHRLWAVIEAKKPVETIIVTGIARDAFATIDTLRKPRSGSDVLALNGATSHRATAASALSWMIRYQKGCLETYKAPQNRVENSDIEEWYAAHPGIMLAVDRVRNLRSICNPAIIAFLYYILIDKSAPLAERMVETLENPAGVAVSDPFFRFRAYLTTTRQKRLDPVVTIALAFKAINAAHKCERIQTLTWRNQGKSPESMPVLNVK